MKKMFFLTFMLSSFVVRSQFTDTATMRVINQNRTAKEGNVYLDTNANVFKIGLTQGKLGFLNDSQELDTFKVINDTLFLYINDIDSVGIALSEINREKEEIGLQYYTWNIANTSQPAITNLTDLGVTTSSGRTILDLNNVLQTNIAPDTDGYIICFKGTLIVKNTGVFTFQSTTDDGSRIYIDNVLILESWYDHGAITKTNSVTLAKGYHEVEFWYYDNTSINTMEFNWGANPDGYTVGSTIKATQFIVK